MLQGQDEGDPVSLRAFESGDKKQHEWWWWRREARRKLPRAITLAVAGLLIYASLFALNSHPCWRSASDCWKSARWRSIGSREGQEPVAEVVELPTGLQHIVFGIAASTKSWPQRQEYVKLWWRKGSAMRGFVWLDGEVPSKNSNSTTLPPIRVSASQFRYKQKGGGRSAVRISRIVSESFRQNLSDVRWFVMGDDDTVFFPDNLAFLLRKYDHRQFFYIGHPSESQAQSTFHSFTMAFGGGGFAISYALAERLAQMQELCLVRYPRVYGSDSRIEACTAELGVPLTREVGFHQIDLRGDIFGLLAAHPVAPLLSLHHVDAVAPIFPNRTGLQALQHLFRYSLVDPVGLLQQSFCYDTPRNVTLSVSSGYAVQVFPGMRTPLELQKPALTFLDWRYWKRDRNLFTFGVRNFEMDSCENPSVFYMQKVQSASNDSSISIATFRRSNLWRHPSCLKLPVPGKIQVLKERHSESWFLAPQRQCCEIVPPSMKSDTGSMNLLVRQCKHDEIIAPLS